MQENKASIIIFLLVTTIIILLLVVLFVSLIYLYQKKQIAYLKNLDALKIDHEKALMSTQLEIQESTFQHISREIHDNISLSLTLAKLHLNTLNMNDKELSAEKIDLSIELLGQSITDLSNISKGLNADIIIQQGLIKALNDEVQRIRKSRIFRIDNTVTGDPIYMNAQRELIIFRIVQEAFNNIIKHAAAHHVRLNLHYDIKKLYIEVGDDGNGFDTSISCTNHQAGLKNMEKRIKTLKGLMNVNSFPGQGTRLSFLIPFE